MKLYYLYFACLLLMASCNKKEARIVTLTFDFLEEGAIYKATVYKDGSEAHWKDNPQDYKIETIELTKGQTMEMPKAAGGGFAISVIKKDTQS